jgi:histidine triad (HIT) family protein
MIMNEKTIFEKIIDREIDSNIIFEDDSVIAIEDISPVAPIHILVIPKKKIITINDIVEEDAPLVGHMINTAKNIAKELGIDENGYRLVFNTNEDGGQSVYHIHLHLLGGRQMDWPPG